MNPGDEFQAWLDARGGESAPAGMTDRIMSAVREAARQPTTSSQSESARKTAWPRAVPYLVFSAAALMLAVRLYSMVSLFVEASQVADVALMEPIKEFPHEP